MKEQTKGLIRSKVRLGLVRCFKPFSDLGFFRFMFGFVLNSDSNDSTS